MTEQTTETDQTQTTEQPDLQATITELTAQVARLKQESGEYRTQRDQALRQSHALRTIAETHKADMDQVNETALSNLTISNGTVEGEFSYTAPSPRHPRHRTDQQMYRLPRASV